MPDIFDKLVGGLNKGVTTVGANSKAMIEKAKTNAAIKNLEDEKKHLAEILGMKVYEMHLSEKEITGDDIAELVSKITKRIEQIVEQQEQLKLLETESSRVIGASNSYSSICKCGFENASGSKFCAKCGSAL